MEGKTLTLNAGNGWKDAFNGLPAADEAGEPIVYTVKEQNVDNYIATYEKGGKVIKEKTYWVAIDAADIEDGETYAITAPDWLNNNTPRIFEGTEGLIETAPVTLKDQQVPASDQILIEDSGSYTQILKGDPSADQLFVATKMDNDGVNPGTFWQFSNGAGNLTLVGNYHWWDNTYGYWYTMTTTTSWDGTNNYQGRLMVEPEAGGTAILSAYQYWGNNWGGLDKGDTQYIYLTDQNGQLPGATHPDPIWNHDWSAHVTFWKQVTVEEATELPDDWTITNSPAGDLTVTKTVEGTDGQQNREFTFVVKLDDESINGTYGDMTFRGGIAMFTLKHGESKTAQDLPVGVGYEVTESAGSDYTAAFSGETGTIEAGAEMEASFTNTFIPCEILLSKVNEDGGKIGGAKFEIYREVDGKSSKLTRNEYGWLGSDDRFTVGTEPFIISGLNDGTYSIIEVKAPEGYVIGSNDPITFTISGGSLDPSANSIPANVKYDKAGENRFLFTVTNRKESSTVVNTGDSSRPAPYVFMTILCAAALAGTVLYRRRKKS